MVVIRYRDDAERKRLEYLIDKYRRYISISKPQGTVLLLDGGNDRLSQFLEELVAKLGPESVEVYEVKPAVGLPEPRTRRLTVNTGMSCSEATGAVTYLMARLRGVLQSSLGGTREYVLRSRLGWARVVVRLEPGRTGCRLVLEVEAYEPALSRVVEVLRRELGVLGEVRVE